MKHLAFALILVSNLVAGEASRSAATVVSAWFIAGDRPDAVGQQNTLQVNLSPGAWSNNGNCPNDAFFIRKEDAHLVAAVLTAQSTGTPVSVGVKQFTGTAPSCQAVYVGLVPVP